MKFTKNNIKNIQKEEAHGGSGMRQVLIKPEQLPGRYFEAMNKGFLNPGFSYDWHSHRNADEFFIVLKGRGKFYWEDEVTDYREGDVITIPTDTKHKISAEGDVPSEYYFVRVRTG